MPIIIFGTRGRTVTDSTGSPTTSVCNQCGNVVSLQPVRQKRYFSLFFIPIIPLEKGKPAFKCPECKALYHRSE
ncbi:MAG: zinc ribbon domain-containing protein [Chloroflexi bacterium]|nr:MAG: zinc ribbon domain-containing protein [Chloroflexota bacterium]